MEITYDHVALRVTDLDRSIQFYREIFDLEPRGRRTLGDNKTEQVVYRVGEEVFVLFRRDEFRPVDLKTPMGMDHLAFTLDGKSYGEVLTRLKERGMILRGPEQNSGSRGQGLATYFRDPDGIEIEIKTYDPDLMARYPA